jgi:hypothetical protein
MRTASLKFDDKVDGTLWIDQVSIRPDHRVPMRIQTRWVRIQTRWASSFQFSFTLYGAFAAFAHRA